MTTLIQNHAGKIMQLPQELINEIVDRACKDNFPFIWILTLVNLAFLSSSRKKQFTTVNIKNTYPSEEHSPTGFTSFFKENKHLLPYPRTVDFQVSNFDSVLPLDTILRRLTNVRCWNFQSIPAITANPFTPLSQPCLEVKELHFSYGDLCLDILTTLLPVLPSLTTLSICGENPSLRPSTGLVHFPSSLHNLHLKLSGLQEEGNISKLLSKITTLTTLTANVINDAEIQAVQNCIDSNVRSLSDLKISSINPIQVNLICLESHCKVSVIIL
ncbi:hypothetical protein F5146DRAFT_1142320 [Armillaria mellea]|nr:hypothetical protein F5146DRAFT_1142320 [Armillaria mellea]